MTTRAGAVCALLLALPFGLSGLARAGETADLHAAWRGCLQRSFTVKAAVTSRTDAVEASLRACKTSEAAYLASLATSPLVDDEDVARARPALIQRAKGWLLAGGPRPL
ncbi:hypothetical protein PMNALOAF_1375 [Methylobacterium adhaesivum]|jgi:hypothetical protein|uniref:DUF1311 domain-containing protein n=1 Tax=Methylobacterium adhaesivum TaxID=333297 RepID=A0ABT8BK15_9HYPH|nr:hypothetical protein [Methylobacterium adhaesivum]MDN3592527.1 hypothetical protein [Methylobacterium adhaesivum]GJD30131.1 hypothetical protein PMNALOAF_1375 [Methylobacterium adhaesivum]